MIMIKLTMDELQVAMKAMVCDHLHLSAQAVTPTAHLFKELGADSLDLLSLVANLERIYQITIEMEELEHLTTLAQICQLVMTKTGQAGE